MNGVSLMRRSGPEVHFRCCMRLREENDGLNMKASAMLLDHDGCSFIMFCRK